MDTNEPFYVGKGINNRCFNMKRGKHFNDIIKHCDNNNIQYAVNILHDNLSEQEAFQYECWYINNYIVDMGFNLSNKTWGGEGGNIFILMTPEEKIKYREKMRSSLLGKNTGIRPKYVGEKISKTKKEKGICAEIKNPMYGKNVKDYMTPEAILQWRKNISKAGIGRVHSEESKKKISDKSKQKVIAELNGNVFSFNSILECKEYFKNTYDIGYKSIQNIINSNKPYKTNKSKYKMLNNLVIKKIN